MIRIFQVVVGCCLYFTIAPIKLLIESRRIDFLGCWFFALFSFQSIGIDFCFVENGILISFICNLCCQPMEIYVDDETKLTLHGLVQVS